MKFTGSAANLEAAFLQHDPIDYESGLMAYKQYNRLMQMLADKYYCSIEQVTAVFVSTSPNNDYMNNLRSTVSILEGWKNGDPLERITISTYHHCRTRAWKYLTGEWDFWTKTKGPKIKSFYKNIIDPSSHEHVTIDGHMVGAWAGRRILMKEVAHTRFNYETIANDAKSVAKMYGLVPCELQAIIWFAWKRFHQVVYNENLNLFGDHWGLEIDPTLIKPFPLKDLPIWNNLKITSSAQQENLCFKKHPAGAKHDSLGF